eukprot:12909985-Prorocentrum_lima.AAC.1
MVSEATLPSMTSPESSLIGPLLRTPLLAFDLLAPLLASRQRRPEFGATPPSTPVFGSGNLANVGQ